MQTAFKHVLVAAFLTYITAVFTQEFLHAYTTDHFVSWGSVAAPLFVGVSYFLIRIAHKPWGVIRQLLAAALVGIWIQALGLPALYHLTAQLPW